MTIDLPVIVDVVIGLVFIYFILSLLASEIQELLATILQWRAKHLKESIEMLLMGVPKKPVTPTKRPPNRIGKSSNKFVRPASLPTNSTIILN
ncbi:MAG: hypothetical protein HC796_00885 [Synechococcaceae cyanobacterium RL_1_2]|nr:hypothetical protein [Synechococcaceae cyanobacterium RL_1_2]